MKKEKLSLIVFATSSSTRKNDIKRGGNNPKAFDCF